MITSTATLTARHDPITARIDAALADARRQARLDDPAAQKMLDAAATLMARGERRLDPRRVARQADLAPVVARRAFKDRVALLRVYRQRSLVAYLEVMKAAVGAADGADLVTQMIRTFGRIFAGPRGISAGRGSLASWVEACEEPDLRAEYMKAHEVWMTIVEEIVAAEIGEGRAPFTPPNVAAILSACVDGVMVSSALQPERSDAERAITTALGLWELVKTHCSGVSIPVDEAEHSDLQ